MRTYIYVFPVLRQVNGFSFHGFANRDPSFFAPKALETYDEISTSGNGSNSMYGNLRNSYLPTARFCCRDI